MSEVKRWGLTECPDGGWVLKSDYDALREELESTRISAKQSEEIAIELRKELAAVKAELKQVKADRDNWILAHAHSKSIVL